MSPILPSFAPLHPASAPPHVFMAVLSVSAGYACRHRHSLVISFHPPAPSLTSVRFLLMSGRKNSHSLNRQLQKTCIFKYTLLKVKWMLSWFSERIHQMDPHDWGQLSVPLHPTPWCWLQGPRAGSCGRSQPDPRVAEPPMRQEGAGVRPCTQLSDPARAHGARTPPRHTGSGPARAHSAAAAHCRGLRTIFTSRFGVSIKTTISEARASRVETS